MNPEFRAENMRKLDAAEATDATVYVGMRAFREHDEISLEEALIALVVTLVDEKRQLLEFARLSEINGAPVAEPLKG